MDTLKCALFGTPDVTANGKPVSLPYKKANALLYYLLIKKRAYRTELTELLWSDEEDGAVALKNLRHAVYSIRKELGFDPFLPGQRTVLELRADIDISCDVWRFLECQDVDAYTGELLRGFELGRASAFSEWLDQERTMLHGIYLHTLLAAAQGALRAGDLVRAEHFARDYVDADPLEENAVLVLMRVYRAQKQYRKAIRQYHMLCRSLSDELSIAPLKETTALYYEIVNDWNASTESESEGSGQELLIGKADALKNLLGVCNGIGGKRRIRCAVLCGEAGVGKTFLIEHLLSRFDFSDRHVCRAYCYQTEQGHMLAPWNSLMFSLLPELEVLRGKIPEAVLKTAASLFPCLTAEFHVAIDGPESGYLPHVDYETAAESALVLLGAVAKRQPLVLAFEDIHWMDAAGVDMLSRLLHQFTREEVLVLCTARDQCPPHVRAFLQNAAKDAILEQYWLYNFTREETRAFTESYMDDAVQMESHDHIYRLTKGNALLLVQLLTAVREEKGVLSGLGDPDEIIGRRLNSLMPEELQVLDTIAACMGAAPFELLSSVLTREPLELMSICERLQREVLLTETTIHGRLFYSVAHERIRTNLIRRKSETARRILHLRIAQYLEAQSAEELAAHYGELIYHCTEGGDRFKALRYRILRMDAYSGACYELLPTLVSTGGEAQPDAASLIGYYEDLAAELERLRATDFSANTQAFDELSMILIHCQSRYYVHQGDYDQAFPLLERLLAQSERADNAEMAMRAHLQYVYYAIQTYDVAVMERHLAFAETYREQLDSKPIWITCLRLRGLLQLMRGEFAVCRQTMEEAIRAAGQFDAGVEGKYALHIAGIYNYIAESWRMEGRLDEAIEYYDRAIAYNRSRGYHPGAALFYTNYGVAAFAQGQRKESRMLFEYADSIYRSFHEYSEYPIALSYLAYFDAADGRFDAAREKLRRADELCRQIGSPWWTGIMIYVTYLIRTTLRPAGDGAAELAAMWPEDEREHCLSALSYLRCIAPCTERDELETALERLDADTDCKSVVSI